MRVRRSATLLWRRLTTVSLPAGATAATGIDAMVHAIEAYASRSANNNPMSRKAGAQSSVSEEVDQAAGPLVQLRPAGLAVLVRECQLVRAIGRDGVEQLGHVVLSVRIRSGDPI